MSGRGTLKNFKAMLAEAKLPETTVPTCLRGDLAAQHEQLNDELERLEKDQVDSLAGNGGAELAERIRELEAEMLENTYPVVLRALPKHRGPKTDPSRPTWPEFLEQNPPRRDADGKISNPLDDGYGFNTETGFTQLIRLSIVDPAMSDSEFDDFLSWLTESQYDSLGVSAWRLNKGDISVPFSRAASRLNRLTADASKPPTD